ncbi:MAG: hypothetical protein IKF19_06545 [Bacilli bacterium]|nr:hypothetical protein [Bacilli bacterium]
MIEYANDSVIRALKQYDMLAKSLKLTEDLEQKQGICYQMTRIIERVLEVTNKIYESKYLKIENKETFLMDEEKNRLLELVNIINERKTYINNQVTANEELTGLTPTFTDVLGEEKLDEYKEKIKIIDTYKNNININSTLKEEIKKLEISIKKAKDRISSNKIMNRQLEEKMIRTVSRAIDKLSLTELKEREKEIDLAYTELGYSLEKAKENAKTARKDCSSEIILECDNMLSSITLEYERYKEKKLILNLMEIYKEPVVNYSELLNKRERINKILTGIVSSELYLEIGEELNKEYSSIKLEQQDVATLKSLEEERVKKLKKLEEIKEENASDKFKEILAHLLENEKKHQEKIQEEKKKEEEKRKLRRLEEEKIRRKEMLRRQKVLEEERKKEIEERTKQLLVEKKKPILFPNKSENQNFKAIKQEKPRDDITFNNKKTVETSANEKIMRASVKPKDDIFTRKRIIKKEDNSIPVVKNNNLRNDFVSTRKATNEYTEIFPKAKLKKENNIFPAFPDMNKNDSFFDEEEFADLNDSLDNNNKKSWF